MLWLKQNGRVLLYMILVLALGAWGGYALGNMRATPVPTPAPTAAPVAEPVSKIGEQSILPTTDVTIRYTFLLCGHTREKHETGGELTGCTLEDITKKYPDARVLELTAQKAVIEREIERYCPDHVSLFIDGSGNLSIAQTDATNYDEEKVTTLNYNVSELPEDVVAQLEEGIILDNLEQVNAYLENAES